MRGMEPRRTRRGLDRENAKRGENAKGGARGGGQGVPGRVCPGLKPRAEKGKAPSRGLGVR